jgi:hypothetical protein
VELELRLRLGLRLGWDERDVGEWFVVNVAGCFGVVEFFFGGEVAGGLEG